MSTIGKSEYNKLIMNEAIKNNKIRYCMMELLDYCNYNCRHCYVHNTYKKQMSLTLYKRHIDELAECGCVWLLLTGGEPLLHPNFCEMYLYAKKKMHVTVFTNGYLLNNKILKTFESEKPDMIEISLYGANAETYDHYVGVEGAFDKVDTVIDSLNNLKIELKLKTLLASPFIDEFEVIRKYVQNKGNKFKYDGFILSKINGDSSTCEKYSLTPNKVIELECHKEGFLETVSDKVKNGVYKYSNKLYTCDAGKNSIFIDANSIMSICSFARHISVDLKADNISIISGRERLLKEISSRLDLRPGDKCYNCENKDLCRYCPGQFFLYNGDEYNPIEWNCKYAKLLCEKIENKR